MQHWGLRSKFIYGFLKYIISSIILLFEKCSNMFQFSKIRIFVTENVIMVDKKCVILEGQIRGEKGRHTARKRIERVRYEKCHGHLN